MFLFSVSLYLFIRQSNTYKTPQQFNNLAMFAIPVAFYIIMAINSYTDFTVTTFEFIFIIVQGVFFSYLGNMLSLKGIEYAPNPGYSLIIAKSYVVFTAIASIFVFNAPLTYKSVLAIVLIIGFSAILAVDKKKDKASSNKLWLPYTIGAFFCFGLLALSTKYLLNIGVPILVRLIYSMLVVTALTVSEMKIKKVKFTTISKPQLLSLLMIGLSATGFNYFMQVAFNLAPNVGYVNATNAGSISLLTVLSALFFKDELTVSKMIGVIGVTLGLVLLFV